MRQLGLEGCPLRFRCIYFEARQLSLKRCHFLFKCVYFESLRVPHGLLCLAVRLVVRCKHPLQPVHLFAVLFIFSGTLIDRILNIRHCNGVESNESDELINPVNLLNQVNQVNPVNLLNNRCFSGSFSNILSNIFELSIFSVLCTYLNFFIKIIRQILMLLYL